MLNIEKRILYKCDRLKCERCSYPECSLTEDIFHAVNFELDYADGKKEVFVEKTDDLYNRALDAMKNYVKDTDDPNIVYYEVTPEIAE